ncbi:MAG TPA: hypothetical protein VK993_09565 [Chthoniobacterales bacterium]|nr:hypothetical protein [Chthoniobacterales bacterium]
MSVTELVKAAKELPPTELAALTAELVRLDNEQWDKQIRDDAASGKLDFLFEEADRERASGTVRAWPED